ncbi:MAG: M61 family metallopeptidase [Sphingobium sp.]|nr:M61 family metallopeptidase [Sphingobium sp.]
MPRKPLIALIASTALTAAAYAQTAERSAPQALPVVETVPSPRDTPWTAGTIKLEVDATDLMRRIIAVKETIPVAGGGPLTLLLPEWLPGKHDARGEIEKVAGLVITANGETIPWTRDPLNVYAFHVAVPQGASSLVVRFQFLAPTAADQGRVVLTDDMANIQWNSVSLYPAGYYARRIPIQATVILPLGWTAASALKGSVGNGARETTVSYEETDYETLVDSPLFAGRFARSVDLGHDVTLNLFADDPNELNASQPQIEAHKKLVSEALALFGARHFDRYAFLLAISSKIGHIGLEHQRSSENQVDPGYFGSWDMPGDRNILPHEFTHSWNGKFRRPELLWTPDYTVPMQNDLLWVYEGQTQLWGYVLGARSGLYTKQQTLDALASIAARLDAAKGREWRSVTDTTYDPIVSKRRPKAWSSWQRNEDYYNDGMMTWLEADAVIQRETKGAKGLDDFARAFFGMKDGDWGQLTYSRQDVVDALNAITPYDWAAFLRERMDQPTKEVTKGGFTLGGYKLSFGETPGSFDKSRETSDKYVDQSFGVGMVVNNSGDVLSVVWDSPAFAAGITLGTRIVAVNGDEYSAAAFRQGLKETVDRKRPLSLIIKQQQRYRVITLDYSGGIRYPRLEKAGEGETSLDRLLKARTGGA